MDYVALYRKWRPQDFTSLIGQEHIKTALCNALQHNRIAHAYLFSGPRGTGKTSTAKILAKAVNCQKGPTTEPCNSCSNCELINNGSSMDVFEIDAASNRGIDEIRELREKIRFSPVEGQKRVYIIDEVHMLTTEAFNALLKTLEEPPEHVLFILATTEPHKIPATILSRCQRYDFRKLSVVDTIARLEQVCQNSSLQITAGALKLIAVQADGGMRDALSLLDQCAVMSQTEIDEETVRSLLGVVGKDSLRKLLLEIGQANYQGVLKIFDELLLGGKEVKQLLGEMSSYLRAVLLYKASPDFTDIYLTDSKENLQKVADLFTSERLMSAARKLHSAAGELRFAIQPRINAELCLLELCEFRESEANNDLVKRLEKLEKIVAGLTGGSQRALNVESAIQNLGNREIAAREVEVFKPEVEVPIEEVKQVQPIAIEVETEKIKLEKAPEQPSAQEAIQQEAALKQPEESRQNADGSVDLTDAWERVLQNLLKQNKRSLHACAVNATLVSCEQGQALLYFKGDFACKRMMEKDYRELVEKELASVLGSEIRLECRLSATEERKQTKPQPQKQPVETEEELPEVVRAALEIFGGEVYKVKK